MNEASDDGVEHVARQIHARGLATPALILFDTFAPLGFIGEQALVALGPLLPRQQWRTTAFELLHILQDQHERDRLRQLLAEAVE